MSGARSARKRWHRHICDLIEGPLFGQEFLTSFFGHCLQPFYLGNSSRQETRIKDSTALCTIHYRCKNLFEMDIIQVKDKFFL
jgi:hypothetical protein